MPAGRPAVGEDRPALRTVTFKADERTLSAIQELVEALPAGVRARQSVAVRQAILDAAESRRTLDLTLRQS